MKYVIGVDAGGTKTSAISYNENGVKQHAIVTGPGNVTVNFNGALNQITKAIDNIIDVEVEQPLGIAVGIAGITDNLKEKVQQILNDKYEVNIMIESDYVLAYHSVFENEGILVVAGTGVVLLGKHNGKTKKLGGWGHLLGDEGSGYELVIRSIKKSIPQYEAFETVPHAINLLMKEMNCKNINEVKSYIYSHEKSDVAKFAPIIITEGQKGDEFALKIVDEIVEILIEKLKLLIRNLGVTKEIPVATMGGILSEESFVRIKFVERISSENLPVQLYSLSEPNRGVMRLFIDDIINSKRYAVGLMSGTSLDGVDAALCEIDGVNNETQIKLVDFQSYPLPKKIINDMKQLIRGEKVYVSTVSSLNVELGELFGEAVINICRENNIDTERLSFIASHGQTVFHEANKDKKVRSTLQLGEPSVIAYMTNAKVISNFRAKDIAASGEGAPLIPKTELILYRDYKDSILLNVGGISNITYLPSDPSLPVKGYDTGPGNMMIDEAMTYFFGKSYDKDGETAKSGKVIPKLIDELLNHWFIHQLPPKSTGRDEFGQLFTLDIIERYKNERPNDVVYTLTLFTAKAVAKHVLDIHESTAPVKQLIIGGGGAYNKTLVSLLEDELMDANIKVIRQEDLGFSSAAKEAIGFVVLGNQTLHKQPGNVPSVTGADREVICGSITWPN